jgi:hypothetical protein
MCEALASIPSFCPKFLFHLIHVHLSKIRGPERKSKIIHLLNSNTVWEKCAPSTKTPPPNRTIFKTKMASFYVTQGDTLKLLSNLKVYFWKWEPHGISLASTTVISTGKNTWDTSNIFKIFKCNKFRINYLVLLFEYVFLTVSSLRVSFWNGRHFRKLLQLNAHIFHWTFHCIKVNSQEK